MNPGSPARQALEAVVGPEHVLTDQESLNHYGRDSCDMFAAAPAAIVFPASTGEVVALVRLANELGLALVPSGGRTGLSGGATATDGEVIVSMQRMNRILDVDPVSRTLRCQAGTVTAKVQAAAAKHGLFYPVDFASSGSSHIGGNIATNAGGINVIRYGMTRNWVAGLEVVTGKGEVLKLNRGLLKNNSGYDLRQLFIGSDGTLGIIIEATLWLTSPPRESVVMVLGVGDLSALMPVLQHFQSKLVISGFEYFPEESLKRVVAAQNLQRPLESNAPFYALIDFECAGEDQESVAMAAFEHCVDNGWVLDGVLSQSGEQSEKLWKLRELIADSLASWTPLHTDVSVPVSDVPAFLQTLDTALERHAGEYTSICFGHVGDGNVHVSILKPDAMEKSEFDAVCTAAVEQIYEVVRQFGGSVSAEHGVALLKKPYLGHTRSREEIDLMKSIKAVFDPNGVMNPGKIFDMS